MAGRRGCAGFVRIPGVVMRGQGAFEAQMRSFGTGLMLSEAEMDELTGRAMTSGECCTLVSQSLQMHCSMSMCTGIDRAAKC